MGSARGKPSHRTSTRVEQASVGLLHDQASPLDPLLHLQQTVGNQAVLSLLRSGQAQAKLRHASSGGTSFQGGGSCAAPRARSRPPLTLQKKCAKCATGSPCNECGEEEELHKKASHQSSQPAMIQRAAKLPTDTSATPSSDSATESQRPAGLIVEDDTKEISSEQMRKTEFLSVVRNAVRPVVEKAPQIGPASNESYVDKWIADSGQKTASHLERAIIKYAPGAAGATTAQGYVDAVVAQVEWGVTIWSTTGNILGLPPTFARDLPETQNKPPADEETVQRKSANGKEGDEDTGDVAAIRDELSGGNPLASSVRGPMEEAYGTSFSNVKVHTDSRAAELSTNLDARAFTIGNDIAFAAGEFKPGTLVGDALIAHELAHVAQQQGAASGPATKGVANYGSLEEDADLSAVGAMASIWGGVKEGLAGVARSAIPKLRSGLKLQRCDGDSETKGQTPSTTTPSPQTPPTTQPPAPTPTQTPTPTQKPPDFSICTNEKNRKKVEEIVKTNPRNYDLKKVTFHLDKFTKNFTEVAKKYVKDNKVTGSNELGIELKALNKGVSEQDGMCVVVIKGWESAAALAKEKRENCAERIKEFQADASLKHYKEWVTETVSKDDKGYEPIVERAAKKKAGLFEGRKAVYAEEVKRLNNKWIDSLNENECVALPVGWKDTNIGTLPTKPAAGTLKKTDPAAQAIAVVYAEQTRTSKEAAAAANFEEQQKYIWFSIRKRVTGANYPPDLASVLDPGQYHAIGQSDYNAALDDLEKNDPPTIEALKRAKKVVLDNWTSGVPADAGAGYFHWRSPSTPNTCFAGADKLKAAEKEKKEKQCAWEWAKSIKIVGNVTKEQGWLKRIRAAGDDPVGSMYIYPGD